MFHFVEQHPPLFFFKGENTMAKSINQQHSFVVSKKSNQIVCTKKTQSKKLFTVLKLLFCFCAEMLDLAQGGAK